MNERTDTELVDRGRGGDPAAIGELFLRYWRAARAAAFGITGEIASAEDAAAEGFQQALARLHALRDSARFGSWLRIIVIRRARLERRNRRETADASTTDLAAASERQDEALERIEVASLVQHAVRTLPGALREAMALVYFEGYEQDSAAGFLGVPPGTLRRRLHDGRQQLRRVVGDMLRGSRRMNEEQDRDLERLNQLLEDGAAYTALRNAMALRPVSRAFLDLVLRHHAASHEPHAALRHDGARTHVALSNEARAMISQLASPSARALDPNHPVGAAAIAIRGALTDFEDWPIDPGSAAGRFFAWPGSAEERWRATLPPGFAEGRAGAFVRMSRGLLHVAGEQKPRSMYELLQGSADEETFRAAAGHVRLSDVIDLVWMRSGPLELRSVQELLERLGAAVLADARRRFSSYDEPRYRTALQLHVDGVPARLASGGVLAPWPGGLGGTDAAHVRLILEPWAALRSGQPVNFEPVPWLAHTSTNSPRA